MCPTAARHARRSANVARMGPSTELGTLNWSRRYSNLMTIPYSNAVLCKKLHSKRQNLAFLRKIFLSLLRCQADFRLLRNLQGLAAQRRGPSPLPAAHASRWDPRPHRQRHVAFLSLFVPHTACLQAKPAVSKPAAKPAGAKSAAAKPAAAKKPAGTSHVRRCDLLCVHAALPAR